MLKPNCSFGVVILRVAAPSVRLRQGTAGRRDSARKDRDKIRGFMKASYSLEMGCVLL
jgi:hypothetical protein